MSIEELQSDPLIATVAILSFYFVSALFAAITIGCFATFKIGLVDKTDSYETKLRNRIKSNEDYNKGKKLTYSTVTAAGKFRKKNSINRNSHPQNNTSVDSSPSFETAKTHERSESVSDSIPYADAEDSIDSDPNAKNDVTINIQAESDMIGCDTCDHEKAVSNDEGDKPRRKSSKAMKFAYQESILNLDELDIPRTINNKDVNYLLYDNAIRSRHPSGAVSDEINDIIVSRVLVNTDKIKRRRRDRYRTHGFI